MDMLCLLENLTQECEYCRYTDTQRHFYGHVRYADTTEKAVWPY